MQKSAKRAKPPPKPDTPPAADGRKHIDVQTEQYLEELTDRPIEADIETQTDAFMDQLPAPIFIPMKTGVDVETQIYDGDLFDFDAEVDPILEVRVCMHAGFAGRGVAGWRGGLEVGRREAAASARGWDRPPRLSARAAEGFDCPIPFSGGRWRASGREGGARAPGDPVPSIYLLSVGGLLCAGAGGQDARTEHDGGDGGGGAGEHACAPGAL